MTINRAMFFYNWRRRIRRIRQGWRLATGRLTCADAQDIAREVDAIAGYYPLSTLCTEDVISLLLSDYFSLPPEAAELVVEACEYVCSRWDDTDNDARTMAKAEFEALAARDGIQLSRRRDTF